MKNHFILFIALSATLLIASCKKDEVTEAWLRGANSLIKTTDGNLLASGYNMVTGANYQGCLTKLDNDGNILWSFSYGTSNSDGFFGAANTANGGFIATGYSYSADYNYPNLLLVKTDAAGNQEWLSVLTDFACSQGISVIPAIDSGYVVCGYMMESLTDDRDILIAKFGPTGNKLWVKRFGGKSTSANNYDEAYDIIASGGNYFVTGSTDGYSNCCGNAFLMRTSASGDSLWQKTYSSAIGYSLEPTADYSIIIGGTYFNGTEQDFYLLKTGFDGVKQWENHYTRAGYDYGTTVVPTTDGGFALSGNSTISDDMQVRLLKVDASGTESWQKSYGGDNVEQGYGLVQNSDGSFTWAGLSNTGGSFYYIGKSGADGSLVWEKRLK
ncbi:MAG TPA: hypothetical protein PLP88_08495 [Bacteroidales bacterium]|nr:hypothetical protein [Bacteroidales bacterium]